MRILNGVLLSLRGGVEGLRVQGFRSLEGLRAFEFGVEGFSDSFNFKLQGLLVARIPKTLFP